MAKRTDQEAIEDVMTETARIEMSALVILARSDDKRISREAKLQLACIERQRATLSNWWRKARRRKKS